MILEVSNFKNKYKKLGMEMLELKINIYHIIRNVYTENTFYFTSIEGERSLLETELTPVIIQFFFTADFSTFLDLK